MNNQFVQDQIQSAIDKYKCDFTASDVLFLFLGSPIEEAPRMAAGFIEAMVSGIKIVLIVRTGIVLPKKIKEAADNIQYCASPEDFEFTIHRAVKALNNQTKGKTK